MRQTARDKVIAFLEDDRRINADGPGYLGVTNGVIEVETKVNGNTVRKVLGSLVTLGTVRVARTGTTACYRLA